MALYAYKAMNNGGRVVTGRMDAINQVDLELRLKRIELDYITGDPIRQGGLFGHIKVSRQELINFCFHLEQLGRAGVPILEGLTDLRDSLENPRFKEVIAGMIESIGGGKTLSAAMAEHPAVFDGVFISLVRAGEESGNLPDVLKNLVESLKWQDELAAHTKKLVTYPAVSFAVVISVTMFLMMYLVPKMAAFIKNMGQDLPMQTKIMIFISGLFVNYWYAILGIPVLIVAALVFVIRRNSRARFIFDETKLRLPVVGDILRKIILSRFAAVFSMMYASGISILDSIRATENVVGNAAIKQGLIDVGEMIAEGQHVTVAFQNAGLFPPLVIRMLRVGENTGALDTALANVSYFYTRDVRESIERAQAMIEPAMILFIAAILGGVMLSVLGPIYDIITKLKT